MRDIRTWRGTKAILIFYKQFCLDFIFFLRFAIPKASKPSVATKEHGFTRVDNCKTYISYVEKCILQSQEGPLLPFPIRILQGMSGQRFRVLLNNLARIPISGSYLEVGTFKGSTAISALFQNQRSAIFVDNWSEFGGPKKTALENLKKLIPNTLWNVIDQDFKTFSTTKIQEKIAIYFYDGGHSFEEQKLAVSLIDSLNFDYLVFIVDDYSWGTVQQGTLEGLNSLSSKLVQSWEILPNKDDKLFRYGNWHNGYFVCLMSKP
jgi:hypothetical protein